MVRDSFWGFQAGHCTRCSKLHGNTFNAPLTDPRHSSEQQHMAESNGYPTRIYNGRHRPAEVTALHYILTVP